MPRAAVAGTILNAAALACVVTAYVIRDNATIEGAYFNRSVGGDDTFVVSGAWIEPWLIAAGVLLAAGTALLVHAVRRRASRA